MNETIKAWAYSRIDAPEDSHGSLKHQDQQLCEYADKKMCIRDSLWPMILDDDCKLLKEMFKNHSVF